jgi:TRAP-type C4-dicarboxylate transport system permease large subunit
MIFLIIMGATALGQLLALTGATRDFLSFLVELALPTILLVILIHAAVLLLGFFIDQLSIMLVAIPVLIPVVDSLAIDPVWFWVLFLMNISIGAITPPFGLMLFALKGVVPQASMSDLYRAALPYVALDVVALGLVMAFPAIATWLPNLIT